MCSLFGFQKQIAIILSLLKKNENFVSLTFILFYVNRYFCLFIVVVVVIVVVSIGIV